MREVGEGCGALQRRRFGPSAALAQAHKRAPARGQGALRLRGGGKGDTHHKCHAEAPREGSLSQKSRKPGSQSWAQGAKRVGERGKWGGEVVREQLGARRKRSASSHAGGLQYARGSDGTVHAERGTATAQWGSGGGGCWGSKKKSAEREKRGACEARNVSARPGFQG